MRCLIVGGFVFGGFLFWQAMQFPPAELPNASAIAAGALSLPVLAVLYSRQHVIHLDGDETELVIVTASLFGFRTLTFDRATVSDLTFYEGRRSSGGDLPFATLRFAGHWLPYLIDMTSGRIADGALNALHPDRQQQARQRAQKQKRRLRR